MLPVEASSVIGSIAGVAEIAKEAFGGAQWRRKAWRERAESEAIGVTAHG